jgi:hypothetical protein
MWNRVAKFTQATVLTLFLVWILFSSWHLWKSSTLPPTQEQQTADVPDHDSAKIATDKEIARYTWWLAVLTGLLAVSTVGLWIVTAWGVRNQRRETEIIQRAYVSVEPNGLTLHYNRGDRVVGSVILRNVGHLPARNVRWYGTMEKRGFSFSDDRENFPVEEPFEGKIVLPPGAETRIEIGMILTDILGTEAYVSGIVNYDDGFGNTRYTKFCHRYRTRHLTEETIADVPGKEAALHPYGNDAN